MALRIEKKIYDPNGTETHFGLPCTTIVEEWEGEVESASLKINDAYFVENINIDDNNSNSIYPLLFKIYDVQKQNRHTPQYFTKPIVRGYGFNADGSTNYGEQLEEALVEIPSSNMSYCGQKIKGAYRCSKNVSFGSVKGSAYSLIGSEEVVFVSLKNEFLSNDIKQVLDNEQHSDNVFMPNQLLNTETDFFDSTKYSIVGCMAKNNLNGPMIVFGIKVGINGGVPKWMIDAVNN